jgi:hypothetical protein
MPNLVFLSLDKNSLQPFLGGLYAVIHKQTDFFDVACLRFPAKYKLSQGRTFVDSDPCQLALFVCRVSLAQDFPAAQPLALRARGRRTTPCKLCRALVCVWVPSPRSPWVPSPPHRSRPPPRRYIQSSGRSIKCRKAESASVWSMRIGRRARGRCVRPRGRGRAGWTGGFRRHGGVPQMP